MTRPWSSALAPPPSSPSAVLDVAMGRCLARLRVERGEMQGDLARRAGISQATLSRIERGRVSPALGQLAALAAALDVHLSRLVQMAESAALGVAKD